MSTERALLQRLLTGPASGTRLADEAGHTRAAIWKRIASLRAAGIAIQARAGHGYALAQPLELLDAATIRHQLPPAQCAQLAQLDVAWSLDSTNSELLRQTMPADGAVVLLAERQTAGRGRRGRNWASPLAANVYLSLARHYSGGLAQLGGLSLVAGIAVVDALRAMKIHGIGLKWPNDLVVAEGDSLRKLGGILVEGSGEHAGPVHAVIGVGLNVRMPPGFASIDQPWIDLATLTGNPGIARNDIAASVITHLLKALQRFEETGLAPFLVEYADFDALAGRDIELDTGTLRHRGTAQGLAADGALRVRSDGVTREFHAGDISVRCR